MDSVDEMVGRLVSRVLCSGAVQTHLREQQEAASGGQDQLQGVHGGQPGDGRLLRQLGLHRQPLLPLHDQ